MSTDAKEVAAKMRAVDGLAWREVDGDVFVFGGEGLLHIMEGPVSCMLWTMLDSGVACRDALLASIVTNFEVDDESAGTDLDSFLERLLALHLIEPAHE